mgnify:CR=1 FL=1
MKTEWHELYPSERKPEWDQIIQHIGNPLWDTFHRVLQTEFGATSRVEYSRCSAAPGWNVKYRKGGRALCTLYPRRGFFICLVCIGPGERTETELRLKGSTQYMQALYANSSGMNDTKWLMANVTDTEILRDVLMLVTIRMQTKGKKIQK